MNNEQLNNLVLEYQNNRSEETFEQIYEMISANWRRLETVGKSVRASESEMIAFYEDTLLRCIESYDSRRTDFKNFLNQCIKSRRCDIYRKKKRLSEFEVYYSPTENEDGSEAANFEIADEFNLEAHITAKKKADQRQLIDSLLNGADETTTAIVEAFLAHPKPTATAIAKELGYHHSKVTRALSRLQAKFSTKQFGDYNDYLIAL
jgi:DNA-directed RNA polymerase specialized sigma24 family protein